MKSTSKNSILIILLLVVLFCILFFAIKNFKAKDSNSIIISEITVLTKRQLIEKEYIEFQDFENQTSFAGKSVKYEFDGLDYYFVYMVHGSGVPIVEATCFRVDRESRVFMTGKFPDILDSYIGYVDINSKNCRGIK